MRESIFQHKLIQLLRLRFPGCIVLKNDPTYKQGIPDLIILWEDKWATLECKASSKSSHSPNQDYYVEYMDRMSFSAFISPENYKNVIDNLEDFMFSKFA